MAEGQEDAQSWGSVCSPAPSLQLGSSCLSAMPQFPLCSVPCPLGSCFSQGRDRWSPPCSYRWFPAGDGVVRPHSSQNEAWDSRWRGAVSVHTHARSRLWHCYWQNCPPRAHCSCALHHHRTGIPVIPTAPQRWDGDLLEQKPSPPLRAGAVCHRDRAAGGVEA